MTNLSAYDTRYEIRLAYEDDIEMIMDFIDAEWKKGHILATNRAFFEYEFKEDDGTVNIVIAVDKDKKTMEGMAGFLKASHDPECMDIWGAMWKVRPGNMALLGIELIKKREEYSGCRHDIGIGNNPKTAIPLFKTIMKRQVGKMNHYYRLADKSCFQIANVVYKPICEEVYGRGKIIEFTSINELNRRFDLAQEKSMVPYKDAWYIEHRFFNHMIYKYNIYGIEIDGIIEAVFVTRRQVVKEKYIVRIVDYIGKQYAFGEIGAFFTGLLESPKCEYIDFYNLGFDDRYLKKAGFTCRSEMDENIIPNYFSPFLQKNIDIWVSSTADKTFFCKADGDQDRPN